VLAGGLTKKMKAEQTANEGKADAPVEATEADEHEREVGSGPLFAGRLGENGGSGGGERSESEDSRGESIFGMFGSLPRNVLPPLISPSGKQPAPSAESFQETSNAASAASTEVAAASTEVSAAPTEVSAIPTVVSASSAVGTTADSAVVADAGAIPDLSVGSIADTSTAEPSITGPFVTSGISWAPEGLGGSYALYHIRVTPQRANATTVDETTRNSPGKSCLEDEDSKPFTVYHRFQDFKVLQVRKYRLHVLGVYGQ